MTITFERVIQGIRFTGLAEVEPAEKATAISPAWSTIVTVWRLHLEWSDKDVIDVIDPAIVQRIEAMIVEAV
jgi:hypothetical protein